MVDGLMLTAKEAAVRVGLGYALLDSWSRGPDPLLQPMTPAHGQGTRRRYSFRDLIALRVADELRLVGVRAPSIRAVAAHVQNDATGIDSPDAVRAHNGLWIALPVRRGQAGRPFSVNSPSEAKRIAAEGSPVCLVIDVIALARQLAGPADRVFRLPPRRMPERG